MYAGFYYINTDMCALCIHIINIPCVHGIKVLKDVEVFQKQHKASRCCYAAGTTALRVRRGFITIFFQWLMFHMSASLKSHRTLSCYRWWLAWHQWESGRMFVVAQTENSYIICCLSFVLPCFCETLKPQCIYNKLHNWLGIFVLMSSSLLQVTSWKHVLFWCLFVFIAFQY